MFRSLTISLSQPLKLCLASVAVLLQFSCSNKMEDLPDTDDTDFNKERAFGVTFYVSQSGHTKAMLYSNIFERYQDRAVNYVDFLDSVYVEFYNEALVVENVLTAERARYYPETGDIVVKNNVRVITKEQDTLYTQELFYNERLEKIYTTTPVRIQNGPQVTTGEYLEATKDFSWVRIYRQKGTIPVKDSELNSELE